MAKDGVSADVRAFNVDVREFAKQTNLAVNKASRSLAFALFERLVQRTPRVTGFLQSGWNLTIDKPDFTTRQPGLKDYSAKQAPLGVGFAGEISFSDFYIANGVEYAVRVDEGYPNGQAPEGIVRPALADLDFTLEQFVEQAMKEKAKK